MDNHQYKRICDLVVLYSEGVATKDDILELEGMLDNNKEAIEYYIESLMDINYFYSLSGTPLAVPTDLFTIAQPFASEADYSEQIALLYSLARDEKTAPAIELPKEKPQPELVQKDVHPMSEKRKMSKFQLFTFIVGAAAVLFLIIFPKIVPQKTYSEEMATLVDQLDVKWGDLDSHEVFKNGSRLYTNEGIRKLQKGTIKIVFDCGAEVVIQGPTEFELENPERMKLVSGRLNAKVPKEATGFTVRTPFGSIVDFGTEFSVEVNKAGKTLVEVFKGIVELRDSSNPMVFTKYQKLKAGQKGTIDTKGTIALIDTKKDVVLTEPESYPNNEIRVYWQCPEEKGYWDNPSFWTQNLLRDPSLVTEFTAEDGPKKVIIDNRIAGDRKIMARRADVCQLSKFPVTVQMDGGQVQFEQIWIGRTGLDPAAEGRWIMSSGEIILKGRDPIQLFIGDKCKGRMEVNGGRIEIFGGARIGCNEWYSTETFIDGDGTLLFNDGQLSIYGILEVAADGGTGRILLNGGQINAFDLKIEKQGLLVITGGTLILEGDKTAVIQTLIDRGLLLCPDREIQVEYDQEGINKFGTDKTVICIKP